MVFNTLTKICEFYICMLKKLRSEGEEGRGRKGGGGREGLRSLYLKVLIGEAHLRNAVIPNHNWILLQWRVCWGWGLQ